MLIRKPRNLPRDVYPQDPWRIVETRFHPPLLEQAETIFSLSNGYLGMRGCFEEGAPIFEKGTYINGFYERWPICYGESAHGFPSHGQTIVNVPDTKGISLRVNDEPLVLSEANLSSFERVLDMSAGTLDRNLTWETPSGKRVTIRSRRFVSYPRRHLAALRYEVTVENAAALVSITSGILHNEEQRLRSGDPRLHHAFKRRVLLPRFHERRDSRLVLGHATEESGLGLACGIDHVVESDVPVSVSGNCGENSGHVEFSFQMRPGATVSLTKFMAYHTDDVPCFEGLRHAVDRTLDRAMTTGFSTLLVVQKRHLDRFWARGDVRLEDDPDCQCRARELQQALRFNLFQIFQATHQVGRMGVAAKGLTGQAYDGNYFWDTEAYVLPFLIHTAPHLARRLLDFRYRMLEPARRRAREVSEQGALFPWRTITGEEASAYYAAGTAQYHINGDIMYALQQYVAISGDTDFLFDKGAEMLAETARMWCGLGFFSDYRDGSFCIHGVTGPDEYTTVVDNNLYTNLIAQSNLHYAADTLERLLDLGDGRYEALAAKIDLRPDEIRQWRRAADRMYLPYDARLRVHPQDDSFLRKKVWDFANTPQEHYPLLLHYHPLVIYRQQVIKQADMILAMLVFGDRFSLEQKKRNFDYYSPLTTGDSSLSVCIEGILALEVGELDKALEYAHYAVLMDLDNVEGNVKEGCHIASLAGSWMLCVHGLAGLREYDGRLTFRPRLPHGLVRLCFPLTVRGRVLDVEVTPQAASYRLRKGAAYTLLHYNKEVSLAAQESRTLPIAPLPEAAPAR